MAIKTGTPCPSSSMQQPTTRWNVCRRATGPAIRRGTRQSLTSKARPPRRESRHAPAEETVVGLPRLQHPELRAIVPHRIPNLRAVGRPGRLAFVGVVVRHLSNDTFSHRHTRSQDSTGGRLSERPAVRPPWEPSPYRRLRPSRASGYREKSTARRLGQSDKYADRWPVGQHRRPSPAPVQ